MEHNGVEYTVLQTANPTAWVWSFQISGQRVKTGKASSRQLADVFARAAIDKAIRVKRAPKITKQ